MCEITATELKRNFGKYMLLGHEEEIAVTHRGKDIFTIINKIIELNNICNKILLLKL